MPAGVDGGAAHTSLALLARAARWVRAFVKAPGRLAELARYTAVSATALLVDLAAFAVLIASGALPATLAGAFSVLAGLAVHYLLSVRYVFDAAATGKSRSRLVGEYALTGVLGFLVTWSAIALTVDVLGMSAGLGKLTGVGATFVTVYIVRAGLVFRPDEATPVGS